MNLLEQILLERRSDISKAKRTIPVESLQRTARRRRHRSLSDKLRRYGGSRIIAEVKKASPSAGMICKDYDPGATAQLYEKGGAIAVSVLTEPHRFLGNTEHMVAVRKTVSLPILRKDFICDPYQIYETAANGGDVILLIAAALDSLIMRSLYEVAIQCGLEVIAEAHTAKELRLALDLEEAIIGINSRNLATLKCGLSIAQQLAHSIPQDRLCIAESGIRTRGDIVKLEKSGYDGFLVGEALLRDGDPLAKLKELRGVTVESKCQPSSSRHSREIGCASSK
ncbi:MAG: indole-3-glycerol phosphate synthase TrpC [bacterium]